MSLYEANMHQKAFIFDWSGTLNDNFHLFCAVAERIFTDCGVPAISVEEIRRTFTLPYMKFWNLYIPNLTHERQCELYSKYIHEVGEPELFVGVPQLIKQLHDAGYELFILSSDPISKLQPEVDKSGFAHLLTAVTGDVHEKEHILKRYVSDYNLDLAGTYYVGDTSGDIEAGIAAGVNTVGVTWGFQHRDVLAQSNPDFLIDSLDQLADIIY